MALALAYRDFAFEQKSRWRALFEHRMDAGRAVPAELSRRSRRRCSAGRGVPGRRTSRTRAERFSAARALFSAVHGIVWLALDNKLGAQDAEETERQIRFIVGAAARGLPSRRRGLRGQVEA